MRTLKKNKLPIYYSNQIGTASIYETDENGDIKYIEVDGVKVPVETGEYEPLYGDVIDIHGNISMSGDETVESEYGIDKSGYDAILILDKDEADISETSLIWFENEVVYKDDAETIPDGNSADYKVLKVSSSINGMKYILGKLV